MESIVQSKTEVISAVLGSTCDALGQSCYICFSLGNVLGVGMQTSLAVTTAIWLWLEAGFECLSGRLGLLVVEVVHMQ